jgi:hypothetical protein
MRFETGSLKYKTALLALTLLCSDYLASADNSGPEALDLSGNMLCINDFQRLKIFLFPGKYRKSRIPLAQHSSVQKIYCFRNVLRNTKMYTLVQNNKDIYFT